MLNTYTIGKVRRSGNILIVTIPKGTIPEGHTVKIIDIEEEIERAGVL